MKASWVWLAVGVALGLAAGLIYTWGIQPVEFYDTYPPLMREDFRADWIRMTALAYAYDGDLERAHLRLQRLAPEEIRHELLQTLDAAVASGRPLSALQRLATLAQDYGADSPAVRIYTGEETVILLSTPTRAPTSPPLSTTMPSPTATATATPLTVTTTPTLPPIPHVILPTPTPLPPPYRISQTIESCLPEPRLAISLTASVTVTVRGREQRQTIGLPGKELWLLGTDDADHAFTGLRPAQGLGYADFNVEPEHSYNLYIETPTGAPVATLKTAACTATGEGDRWQSWLIILQATGSP